MNRKKRAIFRVLPVPNPRPFGPRWMVSRTDNPHTSVCYDTKSFAIECAVEDARQIFGARVLIHNRTGWLQGEYTWNAAGQIEFKKVASAASGAHSNDVRPT